MVLLCPMGLTDCRFFLDGWLNILYLVVFVTIVVILRPTPHNSRFAMSDEVSATREIRLTVASTRR